MERQRNMSRSRPRGDPRAIPTPLGRWYRDHRRDLPWRHTRDPYAIWLSEVMLQQTRVQSVIRYYERFLGRFPTVGSLATASEDEVLELWAGLGYYSRGRNLRHAAAMVVDQHDGKFPSTLESLRALPGIGEYTAAAIGSIAFDQPTPVIDGNVERVLCRHGGIAGDPKRGEARRAVRLAAENALDPADPGDHNQAMMELGAMVCLPRAPRCGECPIESSCVARSLDTPEAFPPPRARRDPETQHWVAVLVGDGERFWVVPRGDDEELLPGHRGLPLSRVEEGTASDRRRVAVRVLRGLTGRAPGGGESLPVVRHSITHRRLKIHPVRFTGTLELAGAEAIGPGEVGRLAALFRKIVSAGWGTGR